MKLSKKNIKVLPSLKYFLIVLISLTLSVQASKHEQTQDESNRRGKLFSLFNVVQFSNSPCMTSVSLASGGRRAGTCFTATECRDKGGSSQGSCASGFGVCCLFIASTAGSAVVQNCSYIQNPGFPSMYTNSESVSYTINRCSSDVCYLRLDFESFTLLGTGETDDSGTCQDQFQVTVSSGQTIPVICGENRGQHMYVELNQGGTDAATLEFDFSNNNNNNRNWDIKVTQYQCGSENAPGNGCLQYHTGLTGRITTFNYDLNNDNHLPNQEYSICIRQENGFCCVQYQLCQDELATAFSLSSATEKAMQDSNCLTEDFVRIPGSSSLCSQTNQGKLTDRYCGSKFNDITEAKKNTAICDCTAPFLVEIFTNKGPDGAKEASKGLCLDYTQIPCTG